MGMSTVKKAHYTYLFYFIALMCVASILCTVSFAVSAVDGNLESKYTLGYAIDTLPNANTSITRLEYCDFLYQTLENLGRHPLTKNVVFQDCQIPFVNALYHANIVNGNENKLFLPNNYITQEEAVVLLSRTMTWLDISLDIKPELLNLNDRISPWAVQHVWAVYQAGLVDGDVTQFEPTNTLNVQNAYLGLSNLYNCAVAQLNRIRAPKTISTYNLEQVTLQAKQASQTLNYCLDEIPIVEDSFVSYISPNFDMLVSYLYVDETNACVIINYSKHGKTMGNVHLKDIWGEKYTNYHITKIQDLVVNIYYYSGDDSISLQYWPSGSQYGTLGTKLPLNIESDKDFPGVKLDHLQDLLADFSLPQFLR